MKRCFLAVIAMIATSQAMAVDGYKDMKFGMSKAEIIKMKPCAMYKGNGAPEGAESLECDDFKFGGKKVGAGFFFIDGKFERIGIMLDADKTLGVATSLRDKYGDPSSASTKKQLEAVDTTPGANAFIAFDDDTIYLRMMTDEAMNQAAILIYTSKSYDDKLVKKHASSIDSDI
jgi:hypothetical protein